MALLWVRRSAVAGERRLQRMCVAIAENTRDGKAPPMAPKTEPPDPGLLARQKQLRHEAGLEEIRKTFERLRREPQDKESQKQLRQEAGLAKLRETLGRKKPQDIPKKPRGKKKKAR